MQFNHTQPTKTEMRLLVGSLNERLGNKRLVDAVLNRSFENAWPKFEADFEQIIDETESTTPVKDARKDKEILGEILELVRNAEKRFVKIEQDTYKNYLLSSSNYDELNKQRDQLNNWIKNFALNQAKPALARATAALEDIQHPVMSEIWSCLKEGLGDEEIVNLLTSKPHQMASKQAVEKIYTVRKMLQFGN